jgi:hypothetical protein
LKWSRNLNQEALAHWGALAPKEKNKRYLQGIILTWSLTLREELRVKVFENMVLRRIFGSKGTR